MALLTPKIGWGAGYANDWIWNGPADYLLPDFEFPGGDASVARADTGTRDRWIESIDHVLGLVSRLVPIATNPSGATGYKNAGTGVYHALLWMDSMNPFRYFPNKDSAVVFHDCQLITRSKVEYEKGGSHLRIELRLVDVNGSPFTDCV